MTAKKKTLIELMLDAGITPELIDCEFNYLAQNASGDIFSYVEKPYLSKNRTQWFGHQTHKFVCESAELCANHKKIIVTKQQFIDAYNERNNQKEILPPVAAPHLEMTEKTNIAEVKSTEDIEPCKHVDSSAYDVCTNETEATGISLSFESVGRKPADAATAIQPKPRGTSKPILGMVLADLTNRALEGKEKYGEPLKAGNGRNALWDAYQEALDLAMYLRQAIEEQGSK